MSAYFHPPVIDPTIKFLPKNFFRTLPCSTSLGSVVHRGILRRQCVLCHHLIVKLSISPRASVSDRSLIYLTKHTSVVECEVFSIAFVRTDRGSGLVEWVGHEGSVVPTVTLAGHEWVVLWWFEDVAALIAGGDEVAHFQRLKMYRDSYCCKLNLSNLQLEAVYVESALFAHCKTPRAFRCNLIVE